MRARFRAFQSMTQSWESLFTEAADFATELGPKRVISISHSEGGDRVMTSGVITVWFWDDDESADAAG